MMKSFDHKASLTLFFLIFISFQFSRANLYCDLVLSGVGDELAQAAIKAYLRNPNNPLQGNTVLFAKGALIPEAIIQFDRSRSMTFAAVGEGPAAGLSPILARKFIDTEFYDQVYGHLIAINNPDGLIAGAYRIGDITLDLGRAFVLPEFQKTRAFISLLSGIGSLLHFHPGIVNPKKFRALSGAASLSDQFSDRSKAILNTYLLRYHNLGANLTMKGKDPAIFAQIKNQEDHDLLDSNPKVEAIVAYIENIEKQLGKDHKVNSLFAIYVNFGARFMATHHDKNFKTIDWFVFADISQLSVEQIAPFMGGGEMGIKKANEFLDHHRDSRNQDLFSQLKRRVT